MDFLKKIIEKRISKAIKSDDKSNEIKSYLLNEFDRIKKETGTEPVAILRYENGRAVISVCSIKPVTVPDGRTLAEIKVIEKITIDL